MRISNPIWALTLAVAANACYALGGVSLTLLGSGSPGASGWILFKLAGLLGLVLLVGLMASLAQPFLNDSGVWDRPPALVLVVVAALCGGTLAVYQCAVFSVLQLVSANLVGFLGYGASSLAAAYGVSRVVRLHWDPEDEASLGLLAGIGGLLILTGSPYLGFGCLSYAGYNGLEK